jgi:hypothetical protein
MRTRRAVVRGLHRLPVEQGEGTRHGGGVHQSQGEAVQAPVRVQRRRGEALHLLWGGRMKRAEIVKVSEKEYKIMLGNHEIGSSKTDFDGLFHVHAINDALMEAYEEGRAVWESPDEEDNYEEKDKKKPDHYQKGGRCRKCGGLTTYTRQNSEKGECASCEFDPKTTHNFQN